MGGADAVMDRPEQEDEQGLREDVCKRRSVGICCHDSPHDEAVGPCLSPFHTVSPCTGVKIAFAATHFHGFGVAPQGPWITSVNKVRWPKDGRQELQAGGGGPQYQERLQHH